MAGPSRSFVALVLVACAAGAAYKLLDPAAGAPVELRVVQLVRVRGGQDVVVLQEAAGERRLPVPVSRTEASAIERGLNGAHGVAPRALEALGGRVMRASIDEVSSGHAFRAHVAVGSGSREVTFDAPAGEALGMAIDAGAPIVADPELFDARAVSPQDLHGRAARDLGSDRQPSSVLPM